MNTYKKTNAAHVTVPGTTWNSLMEHSSGIRHALGNVLMRLPSSQWPNFLDVRNEYDRACREATALMTEQFETPGVGISPEAINAWLDEKIESASAGDTSIRPDDDAKRKIVHEALEHFHAGLKAPAKTTGSEALFTIDQVHQALLDHGCFSDTQREDILASLSKDVAFHRAAGIPESTAKLTIETLNGDKIVCYGEPLDMITLQKVYRTLLDGHRAWDASSEKSAPIAYLRAKASTEPWSSFELVPADDPNAFPVFGHVLAGAPLGIVDQVDKDDEEWGAHAWVSLSRPVKVGTPVYVAPQAEVLPTSEHGPVVKILGVGPEYRPDEHDRGEWRENEDGVCIEFADGYRDCYYLSDIFAYQPSPSEELLRDVTSYIGCGDCNGASPEQLADRIRDEFDLLSQKRQISEQTVWENVEFLMRGDKMAFKVGAQQFTLEYEPTEPEEFSYMSKMLVLAFLSAVSGAGRAVEVRGPSISEELATSASSKHVEAWRSAEKRIIQLMASMSLLSNPGQLSALELVPRGAVMRVVTQIKEIVEEYTRYLDSVELAKQGGLK